MGRKHTFKVFEMFPETRAYQRIASRDHTTRRSLSKLRKVKSFSLPANSKHRNIKGSSLPDHPNIEEDGVTKCWAELPTTMRGSHKIEEAAGTVGHASASTAEEMNIAESRMNAVHSGGFGAAFQALNPDGAIKNMPQAKSSKEKAMEHFAFVEESAKRLEEVDIGTTCEKIGHCLVMC